jgi:hypothetical protein
MRVLIGCEFSGVVRDAFLAAGHNAVSCDLLPTESPGPHIQGDILDHLDDGWDLGIFHPPCTYTCFAGIRWNTGNPEREQKTVEAVEFFKKLWECKIPKIAIENPIGVIPRRTGIKWAQIVHPWQFGHPEEKKTCLWLRGLTPLLPTKIMEERESRLWKLPPSPDRWKKRSVTYSGIAQAMAEQWKEEETQP